MKLELRTEEGIFGIEQTFRRNGEMGDVHFYINCACGGKDKKYHGSSLKDANGGNMKCAEDYIPSTKRDTGNTFYINELMFSEMLQIQLDIMGSKALIIVCNDCGREFSFSKPDYEDLLEKIRRIRKHKT